MTKIREIGCHTDIMQIIIFSANFIKKFGNSPWNLHIYQCLMIEYDCIKSQSQILAKNTYFGIVPQCCQCDKIFLQKMYLALKYALVLSFDSNPLVILDEYKWVSRKMCCRYIMVKGFWENPWYDEPSFKKWCQCDNKKVHKMGANN